MQYILTKNGKRMPFNNIRRITGTNNVPVALEITFCVQELQKNEISEESLKRVMQDPKELVELTAFTDGDILLNTYFRYSKVEEIRYKYNCQTIQSLPVIMESDSDTENTISDESTEIYEDLIIVTLLRQNEIESKLDDVNQTIDAMVLTLADIMGV